LWVKKYWCLEAVAIDRGSLVETEAKTEAGGVETEAEAMKILP